MSDETYTADSVALFRISGTSVHNDKAVQVDAVCGLIIECSFLLNFFLNSEVYYEDILLHHASCIHRCIQCYIWFVSNLEIIILLFTMVNIVCYSFRNIMQ